MSNKNHIRKQDIICSPLCRLRLSQILLNHEFKKLNMKTLSHPIHDSHTWFKSFICGATTSVIDSI